jgi:PhnB protein
MKAFNTYLNFDKNCRQAMEFYAKCLGAELMVMPFSQGPMEVKPETKDLVLHARLSKGSLVLMASDCPPGTPLQMGNNFAISVDCESRAEVDQLAAALSEKGQVKLPAQDMFWGAYFGMITDQFGINWMFSFATAPQS